MPRRHRPLCCADGPGSVGRCRAACPIMRDIMGQVRLLCPCRPPGAAAQMPPPSSVSRSDVRGVGGGSRSRTPPPALPIQRPPYPPRRGRGGLRRLRLLGPRRLLPPVVAPRPIAQETRRRRAKAERRRKRPPLRGRTQRPPLPPHAARGGAGRLRLRGAKHFLGAGAAGKDRRRAVGSARASPAGAAAPPRYHTPRPCLPPLACERQKTPPPPPKKM